MSDTFKMTTLVGESATGIQDAVETALRTSAEKVHGQTWIEVKDIRANVGDGGTIDRWQVQIEVAFKVDA
jgi:flavin-binding protein dodecin